MFSKKNQDLSQWRALKTGNLKTPCSIRLSKVIEGVVHLSACLPPSVSLFLCVQLSIFLSVHLPPSVSPLSICLFPVSVCPSSSVCPSVCLWLPLSISLYPVSFSVLPLCPTNEIKCSKNPKYTKFCNKDCLPL